jgi:RimJ/RimL family protein N-acetyltransferase
MRTPVPIDAPRSLAVPEEFETDRLLLRCPLPGDGEAVNAAVAESLDSLRPWMDWAADVLPVAETEALQCGNCLAYRQRSAFHFNVFLKQTGEFVSKPALFNIDWKIPSCEIGYWQRSRFQGQGLMTEAVLGVTEFAFTCLYMARVELRCDPRNERSIRVAERAGYHLEGCLRNAGRDPQGSLRDTLVYARIYTD